MPDKKIETVCGYSCSVCGHYRKKCRGCGETKGKPFWMAYVDADSCPVYACCVTLRQFPHCGKCPELMCERFTRFKDPGMSVEDLVNVLAAMERELRSRE